jgi:hypothetical protein
MSNIQNRLKAFSVIDAILFPNKEDRFFSYNNSWDTNEEVCFLKDNNGSSAVYWTNGRFEAYKCFIKDVGIMEELHQVIAKHTKEFQKFHNEEEFEMQSVSAIWYWDDGDCSDYGLDIKGVFNPYDLILWDLEDYCSFLEKRLGSAINKEKIQQLFEKSMFTSSLKLKSFEMKFALDLNPKSDPLIVSKDINTILRKEECSFDYKKEYLN